MGLFINLRLMEKKDLRLAGALTVAEADLVAVDELMRVAHPIKYELVVQKLGHNLLARGLVELVLECECARCLRAFCQPLRLEPWTCLLPLEGEDAAPVANDSVDLTPYLREDILLAFPQHPLCGPGCGGLPNLAQEKRKQPSSPERNGPGVSVWAELDKLKLKE